MYLYASIIFTSFTSIESKQPGQLPVLRKQNSSQKDQVSLAYVKPVNPLQLQPPFSWNTIRSGLCRGVSAG